MNYFGAIEGVSDDLGGAVVNDVKGEIASFFVQSVQVDNSYPAAVDKNGDPIENGARPQVYLRLRSLSDPHSEHVVPMLDIHQKRYPKAWQAFVNGETADVLDGTPLSDLPGVSRRQVEALGVLGVKTIEAAADAPKDAVRRLGVEALAAYERARAWVAAREDAGDTVDLAAEKAKLEAEALELRQQHQQALSQMRALTQQVETLRSIAGPKPDTGTQPTVTQARQPVAVNPNPDFSDLDNDGFVGDGRALADDLVGD